LILKNSEEEAAFVKEATLIIKSLDTFNLTSYVRLEDVVNLFASRIDHAWNENAKKINIMKHSKKWWNEKCSQLSKLDLVLFHSLPISYFLFDLFSLFYF